jgi:hypothetical protein
LNELISAQSVHKVLLALAVGGPLAGAAFGLAWGIASKRVALQTAKGFGVGLGGTAIFGLHALHGALVRHFGLDSVAGLLFALGLFAALALLCGLGIGFAAKRSASGRSQQIP